MLSLHLKAHFPPLSILPALLPIISPHRQYCLLPYDTTTPPPTAQGKSADFEQETRLRSSCKHLRPPQPRRVLVKLLTLFAVFWRDDLELDDESYVQQDPGEPDLFDGDEDGGERALFGW